MTPHSPTESSRPAAGSRLPTSASAAALLTPRRALLAAVALLSLLTLLLAAAAPAFAERPYLTQIPGFIRPVGVSVDASGDLWVAQRGPEIPSAGQEKGTVSEYAPYPSDAKLGDLGSGEGLFSHLSNEDLESAALDPANGYLYVGVAPEVDLFDGLGSFRETWSGFNGQANIHVAVDDSATPSRGRVYVAETGSVAAFTPAHEPEDFSATAPYITANKLTGTPTGGGGATVPFKRTQSSSVGPEGNLFVVDTFAAAVDEFRSSGEFVRQFTGTPAGPFAFEALRSVAVDPVTGNVLIAESDAIDEFTAAGVFVESFTEAGGTPFELLQGMAFDSSGNLYVATAREDVDVLGPSVPVAKFALTAEASGEGALTSTPPGIECGAECSHEFNQGKTVTLTATPKPGYRFKAWGAGQCESEAPAQCTVKITAAKTVKAEFTATSPSRAYQAQLTGTPAGSPLRSAPFVEPTDVATDPAGDAWVTDQIGECGGSSACPLLDKFSPAGQLLAQGPPESEWALGGGQGLASVKLQSIAFGAAADRLYAADQAFSFEVGGLLYAFNPNNATIASRIPHPPGPVERFNYIAVDNSAGSTNGDIYDVSGIASESIITRFGPAGEPAPFSASAPYLGGEEGNHLTGSPVGGFRDPRYLAVDPAGDLYVAEPVSGVEGRKSRVYEFAPSGLFIRQFTGAGAPGGLGDAEGVAVDPTNGNVLIVDAKQNVIDVFDPAGNFLEQLTEANGKPFKKLDGGIAVSPAGRVYVVDSGEKVVDEFTPSDVSIPAAAYRPIEALTHDSATLTATVKPGEAGEEVTACHFEYGTEPTYGSSPQPCLNEHDEVVGTEAEPITSSTEVHAEIAGLTAETTYHYRILAANSSRARYGLDEEFTPHNVFGVKTEPPTAVRATSAKLAGSFTAQAGIETEYFFEYGTSVGFGHKTTPITVPGPASGEEKEEVSAEIENLAPDTVYHYRFVAQNHFGPTPGNPLQFTTTQPPTVEALSTSGVTATSAVLHAKINPEGFPTTYRFEYGTTTTYGQTVPQPEAEIPAAEDSTSHAVQAEVTGLQPGATYHFRLIAHSSEGTVTSEDQSFEFFPPACPNSAVRQQTGSAYLPDCRAYELVSPANAGGTLLFPGGPNTGQATSPSRFSFTGDFGELPGADAINTGGDLYLSTRTDTGWTTHYIGLAGNEAGCMSGPPNDPSSYVTLDNPTELQNTVLADPSMSHLLDFNDGEGMECSGGNNGLQGADRYVDAPSNAPYLWNADGSLDRRLPTDLSEVPAALAALECPYPQYSDPGCTGEVAASADLTHFVFSSNRLSFAAPGEPHGLTRAPGSAYDDDLATGTVKLISTLKETGEPIPQDPVFAHAPAISKTEPGGEEEFLRFPAVSADGSHILISTATAGEPYCGNKENGTTWDCQRFIDTPIHLYMSIDDEGAVEVSKSEVTGEDAAVNYVGMTEDGAKVFFTSEQHLTGEDESHAGPSLYMWSQQGEKEGHPLTLISKADPGSPAGAGDTAACQPPNVRVDYHNGADGHHEGEAEVPWTNKCGVLPFSAYPYSSANGGFGGNGVSDSGIASKTGDIYFFSPEQLAGDRGVPNQANLYDYREGSLHYVTTLDPESHCIQTGFVDAEVKQSGAPNLCSAGPIARMQVTPEGTHMAFLTASRVTSYENAGHLEMYSYTPATESLVCDSCNPDGRPATADVAASEDGLFLTADGRTFFSTTESLLPADTNQGTDVYEYVDGRPRLITPGTGTATSSEVEGLGSIDEIPGLVGVSANGTDVYFSTFDPLLSEDQNGDFLRFYDARTDGGFPQPPPGQPCAAAEECHGPGTESPNLPKIASNGPTTTGGNATPETHSKHHKKHKRKGKRHSHRAAKHMRGGSK